MKEGCFIMGKCFVIVAKEDNCWHLSISKKDKLPSYQNLKDARYKFLPNDVVMAQIFPPKSEFVNVHPYCLHLWEIKSFHQNDPSKFEEDGK